ncbi:MAG: DKNYY domain-containing protein [Ktedonobacteraceae bacterium]
MDFHNLQPEPLHINYSKPFLLVLAVISILIVARIGFTIWKVIQPTGSGAPDNTTSAKFSSSTQSSPAGSTTPIWIACADLTCQSTTTIAQSMLSPISSDEFPDTGYMRGTSTIYYWDDHNDLGNNTLINLHADPNTSVVFDGPNASYVKDENTVWFVDTVVQGANVPTFAAYNLYGWDALHAYYEGSIIPGADPHSFVPIGVNYSKDAEHVYFGTSTVPDADPQTIQPIDDYTSAKDKNHVYMYGKIMPGVNPATYVPPPPG